MDIAPLGFAVDTQGLADAADAADNAAIKITGVADAVDRVADSSEKGADKVKKSTDAHTDQAKAVDANAAAHAKLGQQAKETSDTVVSGAESELAARQRIHSMIEQSMAKYDALHQKVIATNQVLGGTIPKNLSAQAFERSVEAKALGNMGPTATDTAEAAAFRKEMEKITAAVDPAAAKIMRLDAMVETLGKRFDAGRISQAEYSAMLDKIDQKERQLTAAPGVSYAKRHSTLLGEAARTFTYSIPRFGREGRRLINEAENEEAGGSLGGGVMGFARLGLGAGIGMLGAQAFQEIMKLPGEIAKAADEAEMLNRKIGAFDAGSLREVRDTADQLHMSFKGAADALISFNNEFTALSANQGERDAAFTAILSSGRLSGLDEKGMTANADQFAKMVQKSVVSGSDLISLQQQNPELVRAIAQQKGTTTDGLDIMAQTGQLTGAALLAAAQSVSGNLKQQADKLPETAAELNLKIDNAMNEAMAHMGGGIITWFRRNVELPFAQYMEQAATGKGGSAAGRDFGAAMMAQGGIVGGLAAIPFLFGDHSDISAPTSSSTTKVPDGVPNVVASAQDIVAKALEATAALGSAANSRRGQEEDLKTLTAAILAGGNGPGVDALRGRRRSLELQLQNNAYDNIGTQASDAAQAFGLGGGNSALVQVWEQALQVQRTMERENNGVSASLAEIVSRLIEVKEAMQAIADSDELKKLSDTFATLEAQTGMRPGSYDAKVAAHDVEMSRFFSDRRELAAGATASSGAASSAPGIPSAAGGSMSLDTFLQRLRSAESSGHGDYKEPGIPLTSKAGALYAMQVLPSVANKPGYGIKPVSDGSAAEYDRVGTQLATYYYNHFHGDVAKATAAYHSGLKGMDHLGPEGRGEVAKVTGSAALASGPVAAAAPDQTNAVASGRDRAFYEQLNADARNQIGALIGYKSADTFGDTRQVTGGTAGNAREMADLVAGGGKSGAQERLQLEQKIRDTIEMLPPAYREAYAAAERINFAEQQHLKSVQEVAKATQDSEDNERRAAAISSGHPVDMRALELQLKIEEIKERNLAAGDEKQQIDAAIRTSRDQSALDSARVTGGIRQQGQQLADRASLEAYSGPELDIQKQILDAKRQIEAVNPIITQADQDRVVALEQESELLIRQNAALAKQLDTVDAIKGSYKFALDTIGAAWSKMFADMERTGVLHTSTLIRGMEDGFYGMLDRIYQKLVISPLMTALDKLLNGLSNSLLGSLGIGGNAMTGFGGDPTGTAGTGAGAFDPGMSLPVTVATGGVFGPRGPEPYATGGIRGFNAPTRFATGGGSQGIAGEGPGIYEAIMPLARGPDGKLGIAAGGMGSSGSGVTVNINDHRGANAAPVEIQERETGDGRRSLEITLRDAQKSNVASGRMDADYRAAYGISRPPVGR